MVHILNAFFEKKIDVCIGNPEVEFSMIFAKKRFHFNKKCHKSGKCRPY
jgi:hypothetical protein